MLLVDRLFVGCRGRPGCAAAEVLVLVDRQADHMELLSRELPNYGGGKLEAGAAVEGEGVVIPLLVVFNPRVSKARRYTTMHHTLTTSPLVLHHFFYLTYFNLYVPPSPLSFLRFVGP